MGNAARKKGWRTAEITAGNTLKTDVKNKLKNMLTVIGCDDMMSELRRGNTSRAAGIRLPDLAVKAAGMI